MEIWTLSTSSGVTVSRRRTGVSMSPCHQQHVPRYILETIASTAFTFQGHTKGHIQSISLLRYNTSGAAATLWWQCPVPGTEETGGAG